MRFLFGDFRSERAINRIRFYNSGNAISAILSTETICEVSDDTTELSSQEEGVESGDKPGEADASFDTEDEQHAKTEESSETDSEKAKIDAAVGTKNDERVETEESSETE
mgnify:CR=1 FL=1